MYKIYLDGNKLISENDSFLKRDIVGNSLVYVDAKAVDTFSNSKYAIKVYDDTKTLLITSDGKNSTIIVGDYELAREASRIFIRYNLKFKNILTSKNIYEAFFDEYSKVYKGNYKVNLPMDIMSCNSKNEIANQMIKLDVSYKDELVQMLKEFSIEATHREMTDEEASKNILRSLEAGIYGLIVDGHLVSIAKKSRDFMNQATVSLVYTKCDERHKGYSKIVVGNLTNLILDEGKIPNLYVDKTNPISNKLYLSLGYKYLTPKFEVGYNTPYDTVTLAGGCFWCLEHKFRSLDGVVDIKSGYAGGIELDPTYKEVKAQKTTHKEAIKIIYDTNKLKYIDILKMYFRSIDPFDSEGQFIDKGENYKTAIFEDDTKRRTLIKDIFKKIELKYGKKVYVEILDEAPFFEAEEYHQNYASKNQEAYKKEEEDSQRTCYLGVTF